MTEVVFHLFLFAFEMIDTNKRQDKTIIIIHNLTLCIFLKNSNISDWILIFIIQNNKQYTVMFIKLLIVLMCIF